MSEPNVLRELAAGLDNAPELSEADYEALKAAERKVTLEGLLLEEQALWIELMEANARADQANRAWVAAFTKWRLANNDFPVVNLEIKG